MALKDIFSGSGFEFGSFSVSGLVEKAYFYAGIFLILLILGSFLGAILWIRKREKAQTNKKTIIWWAESASGDLEQRDQQKVEEISIPGTRLKLFYDKKIDTWFPRFTLEVKRDCFYGLRTPTGNIVNFSLGGLSKSFKDADIKYDHTDMLWAGENAREFIKRNYKDKSQKWWQVYQGAITTAIFIFIMTFSFVIIIYFMRGMVQDLSGVSSGIERVAQMCSQPPTSGLVGA